jgi:hypothetical protein
MTRALYALVAVALIAVLAHQYQVRIRHQMVDFNVYRTAATRVVAAEPLYRPADGHYQFKYLPAFALAMTPLSALSEATAKVTWFVASVVWLLWLVFGAVWSLPARRLPRPALVLITLALMAKFFGHELTLGQANALLGALLITALVILGRGQTLGAAVLLGLAVFVKPYAIIFWPWLAVTRGARAAAVAAVTIGVGLLVPMALYGWHGNLALLAAWSRTVFDSTAPNLLDTDNISIAAMWAKWLGVGPIATGLAVATSAALVGLVVAMLQRRRRMATADYVDLALLMLLVPLLSPQGWDYVLLLGTPAVVCLVDRWRELGPIWQGLVGASLAALSFTTFDVMGRAAYGTFMDLSLVTVAAVGLVAALAHVRWRQLG